MTHLCMGLCPFNGPFAVDRTDPAPGFAALAGDESLATHRFVVEVGNAKNINKNPVAEKAIQEIQWEILRLVLSLTVELLIPCCFHHHSPPEQS